MIDILNELATLLEKNIKTSLDKPYQIRTYNGQTKTVGGMARVSPSISNTGSLRNQTKVLVKESNDGDGVELVVDFGSSENYAWFVENGRKPGKGMPERALDRWIMTRGLPQFRDRRGRFISNKSRKFLIQRSIKQHGYAGRAFLQSAINMSLEEINKKFGDAAEQFLLDYLDNTGLFGEFANAQKPEYFRTKLL